MFLSPLRVERVGDRWRLLEPLVWEDRRGRVGVPAGFVTDFASIPRVPPVLYALLADRLYASAVLHDWLYRVDGVTRQEADAVFYRAARAEGVPWWTAWLAWLGVRMFGGPTWARYREGPP